jgi:tetratricopeptide (TPR) repeat protein
MPPHFLRKRKFQSGRWGRLGLLAALWMALGLELFAHQTLRSAQVVGTVRDSAGKVVVGVALRLREEGRSDSIGASTNSDGTFVFSALNAGNYTLTLQKPGFREVIDSIKLAAAEMKRCDVVLAADSLSPASSAVVELDDRPNFTVAGVTDTSGSGGHGSETRMRTGEVLARETVGLEPTNPGRDSAAGKEETVSATASTSENSLRAALIQSPSDFGANHRLGEFYFRVGKYSEAIPLLQAAYQAKPEDRANAFTLALALNASGDFAQAREQVSRMLASEMDVSKADESSLHRLLGDLDEKLDDPLAAEHEYERAAVLDPSEQNYFAWGAELLLHRAPAPAIEVFGRGVRFHPDSARMLAGLGAALYTSGSTEDAARRLCQASDLEPANLTLYLFLGKIQEASSTPLPCVENQLARFAKDHPANALANYYYALALWKRERGALTSETAQGTEALLQRAAAIDPQFDPAYLQLGDLYFARADLPAALAAYEKAVTTNPGSSQNHYRLGLTYRRMGEEAKAQREFEQYKDLEKKEADVVERQRRELRQFLFVFKDAAEAPGK